jgi:hypothetical protein
VSTIKKEKNALLDSANHVGLHLGRKVVVDNTETSKKLERGKKRVRKMKWKKKGRRKRTAMVMAMSVSVTVSMGEERKGVLMTVFLVTLDSSETADAGKSM